MQTANSSTNATYSPEYLSRITRRLRNYREMRQAWESLYRSCGEKQQAAHQRNAPRAVLEDLQRVFNSASKALAKARADEEKAAIEFIRVTGGAS